jgi:hypothetical protein
VEAGILGGSEVSKVDDLYLEKANDNEEKRY